MRAMQIAASGGDAVAFRETCGIGAYLDDCTIVAPPQVAAAGLRAFQRAVTTRGWSVNLTKTVCGVGYYTVADGERELQGP